MITSPSNSIGHKTFIQAWPPRHPARDGSKDGRIEILRTDEPNLGAPVQKGTQGLIHHALKNHMPPQRRK